jgi:hypothetical protein
LHGEISFRNSFYIYARTSIGKYLPGNVGHFLGRQFVASQMGIKHSVVVISTILEVLCQITAALMVCFWVDLPMAPPMPLSVILCLSVLALLIASLGIMRFFKRQKNLEVRNVAYLSFWCRTSVVCLLDVLFFLSSGTIIYFLAVQSGIHIDVSIFSFISVYAVAWFLGLVTPGAPAGIGVREAVMIAMLEGTMGSAGAFAVAILFRITTTIGDLLFFASSFVVDKMPLATNND